MKKYSSELKHEIARLVSEGMLTANKAATKYGVHKSDVQKVYSTV